MRSLAWLLLAALSLGACERAREPAPTARTHRPAPSPHRVEVIEVAPMTVALQREFNATIRARRVAHLYTEEAGRIVTLNGYPGDTVRAGSLLARLDDALLQAELKKARATTRLARLDVTRLRKLVQRDVASEDELARAETALDIAIADQQLLSMRLERTHLKAPFDSIISERLHEPGDVVSANSHLLTLFDPASQYAEAGIPGLLLPFVREGARANLRIDALPGKVFAGRVTRIHPTLDPITRLGAIEIGLDTLPAGLKPGQFARARLSLAAAARILVPFTALQRDRDGPFVYLYRDGKAVRRAVRTGAHLEHAIEIRDGLAAGDRVIVRGFLGLRAGKAVEATPARDGAA